MNLIWLLPKEITFGILNHKTNVVGLSLVNKTLNKIVKEWLSNLNDLLLEENPELKEKVSIFDSNSSIFKFTQIFKHLQKSALKYGILENLPKSFNPADKLNFAISRCLSISNVKKTMRDELRENTFSTQTIKKAPEKIQHLYKACLAILENEMAIHNLMKKNDNPSDFISNLIGFRVAKLVENPAAVKIKSEGELAFFFKAPTLFLLAFQKFEEEGDLNTLYQKLQNPFKSDDEPTIEDYMLTLFNEPGIDFQWEESPLQVLKSKSKYENVKTLYRQFEDRQAKRYAKANCIAIPYDLCKWEGNGVKWTICHTDGFADYITRSDLLHFLCFEAQIVGKKALNGIFTMGDVQKFSTFFSPPEKQPISKSTMKVVMNFAKRIFKKD